MTASKPTEFLKEESEICRFYKGRSILITGAAGFLGAIILETLLRCCPDIKQIYILLRSKKGVLPEERKEKIFKKDVFYKIREKNPAAFEKVTVISGDVSLDNLGISDKDFLKIDEVSVVFHCAASISFLQSIRYIFLHNCIGIYQVIQLCKKLQNIDALVYTSTAFSNCNLKNIDEKIYELPFTVDDAFKAFSHGSDEELQVLFDMCKPKFPNYYAFSKCVAENILVKFASDLPVSIIRPSIIMCSWKGVLPGYLEEGSGMADSIFACCKGILCVIKCDLDLRIDYIPVDIAANLHIVGAWRQNIHRLESPSVYNCTSGDIAPTTWRNFYNNFKDLYENHILPNTYQKPSVTFCKNPIIYMFLFFIKHYVPALVIDIQLWLRGKKPRFVMISKHHGKTLNTLTHFTLNEWNFQCDNFKVATEKLNATDAEIFPLDMRNCNLKELINSIPNGSPVFKWENDKKSYRERVRTIYKRYYLTTFIKWSVIVSIVAYVYVAII